MEIRERSIETERGVIAYLESGAGWPVLLLHGFPLHAGMWRAQLESAPPNWRVIAPDFRGFGRTPRGTHPMTIEGFAADTGAVMDALEIQAAAIAGLSMGGYVAFAMFRQEPERVASLVLADTKAAADSPEARAGRERLREVLAAQGTRGVADQMLPKLLSKDAAPEAVSRVRAMIEASNPASADAAILALLARADSTPDLPRISRGTLIVVGEHDVVTPLADAEAMQQGIPRARLAVIPGAGHLSNVEQPEAFSRVVADFLVTGV